MNKNLWNRIIRTIMPKIDETEPENGIIKEFQDKTKLFRLNRLLSDRRVVLCLALALPVVILLTGNYLYNICTASLQAAFSVFQNESTHISFGLENCFRFPSSSGYYVLIVLLILILEIVLPYKIRTSYKDFNVGQKGTERWATTEELRQQYVAVPERDQCFDGAGGVPISWDRERNEILIDRSAVNNYIIGTTRSGKGESYLFTAIDIYSRASIKPSLILCDPKLEVYKMSSKTLRKRGFINLYFNRNYFSDDYDYYTSLYAQAEKHCRGEAKDFFCPELVIEEPESSGSEGIRLHYFDTATVPSVYTKK